MTPNAINENLSTTLEPTTVNKDTYKRRLSWGNILALGIVHISGIYGLFLIPSAKWQTTIYGMLLVWVAAFGAIAGAHRYWSHRSYKANNILYYILFITSTLSFQGPILKWARDHRIHHKFCDTNADPYNAKRGLFFSHIGWLLVTKHPDVITNGKKVDMSDLYAEPLLRFQKKYYLLITPIISFVLPTLVPIYFWNETLWNAWFISTMARSFIILNSTFTINSIAHKWGTKNYNIKVSATDHFLFNVMTFGEGWHNYHHAFPMDYRGGEYGSFFSSITSGLQLFIKIGWAYDVKTPSLAVIKQRKLNILRKKNLISATEDI